ncbi:MAG TPA: hypothetical protein VJT49_01195 [Amycolatopsis sp.]|uniref:hypothetical protein n=1 Tax=Amycolatopsis sp. TaxID=37632 RepID=UPI002B49F48A|nr:hypothetical protein [Amycolatopsis sp.]HKS43730.1 hypothetical protein [Amycolatopsis sp.]
MSDRSRRGYRKPEVTVEPPIVLPMPEADRPAAVAVLAQWLAEVLADESFQQRHQQLRAERRHGHRST